VTAVKPPTDTACATAQAPPQRPTELPVPRCERGAGPANESQESREATTLSESTSLKSNVGERAKVPEEHVTEASHTARQAIVGSEPTH